METLRRRYEESLPVLRELFYTRLLNGQLSPDQVRERAARYEIDLPDGLWTAALVHVDIPGRDELLLLSAQSFLQEHFHLEGGQGRVVLYGDLAALLVRLPDMNRLYPLLEELERLSRLSQSYLGIPLTAGVGLPCQGPEELHRSLDGARSALDYRVLMGGSRVIYIGDLEPNAAAALSFEEEDQRALSAAIKLGTPEQVKGMIQALVSRISQAGLALSQGHLFLLELVTCLLRLTRSAEVSVEEVFGAGFAGAVSISDFPSLEALGDWLEARCLRLHELLGRQRTDLAWSTVERAKDYIARHYADEQLSVESLCSHIHLSPTYFSTLFKRETGISFTAYVTQVRMEEAVRLLLGSPGRRAIPIRTISAMYSKSISASRPPSSGRGGTHKEAAIMRLTCKCGCILWNGQIPNNIEFTVFSSPRICEVEDCPPPFQNDLLYFTCDLMGRADYEVWRCPACKRLHIFENGRDPNRVRYVYKLEEE